MVANKFEPYCIKSQKEGGGINDIKLFIQSNLIEFLIYLLAFLTFETTCKFGFYHPTVPSVYLPIYLDKVAFKTCLKTERI